MAWPSWRMCFFQIYFHVLFLDEQKRVASRYSFVETADGRLFLDEAAVHYYAGFGFRPTQGEVFRFNEDGTLSHDTGKAGGPITRKEGRTDVASELRLRTRVRRVREIRVHPCSRTLVRPLSHGCSQSEVGGGQNPPAILR